MGRIRQMKKIIVGWLFIFWSTVTFAHESTMGDRRISEMNFYLKNWKRDQDNSIVNKSVEWIQMQRPRGTCIPTTSKITVN